MVSVSDDVADVDELLKLGALAAGARPHDGGRRRLRPGAVAACSPGTPPTRFDQVDELHVAAHGTGGPACARQHHRALAGLALTWHDGMWIERASGSGRELCWFPDPVGAHDCYRAELADPLLLVPAFPGVARVSARLSATRRDRITARLPMLRPPHPEGTLGAVRVEVRGKRDGARESRCSAPSTGRPWPPGPSPPSPSPTSWLAAGRRPGVLGHGRCPPRHRGLLIELALRGVKAARYVGAAAVA